MSAEIFTQNAERYLNFQMPSPGITGFCQIPHTKHEARTGTIWGSFPLCDSSFPSPYFLEVCSTRLKYS